MPRVLFSKSNGGLSPPRILPICCATLLVSCGGDSPVAPVADVNPEDPAVEAGSTLGVQDMLGDPLFLSLLDDVADPELASVLRQIVDALTAGEQVRARDLLASASSMAETLEERSDTSLETMILWSVLDRYFEAAGLL